MFKNFEKYKGQKFSLFLYLISLLAITTTIFIAFFIIAYILVKGIPHLRWDMFSLNYTTENASVMPSIINTLTIIVVSLAITCPFGIFSAIYLEEYAKKEMKIFKIIELTTETLAGIPSIIYALFGLLFFVGFLKLGFSILSGSFTISIMILPTIIRVTQEAIKSVSDSYRDASYALGAGKMRTIFRVVLPMCVPTILSGIILSVGRIIGESAALLYTAGTVAQVGGLMNSGRTLVIQMYVLSTEGIYMDKAYATGVILLILVILINFVTNKIGKKISN